MQAKQIALAGACAAAALFSVPVFAQFAPEASGAMTRFYISYPLDARTPKERMPYFGLQLQGSKPYQSINLDSRMFNFAPGALAALELKYVAAAALAGGAAIAIANKGKKSETLQQQQTQLEQQVQAALQSQQPAPATQQASTTQQASSSSPAQTTTTAQATQPPSGTQSSQTQSGEIQSTAPTTTVQPSSSSTTSTQASAPCAPVVVVVNACPR